MLLSSLNDKEKSCFCALLLAAGETDSQIIAPEEIVSYIRYRIELGIASIDSKYDVEKAVEILTKSSLPATLQSIFLELCIFMYSDLNLDIKESAYLKDLAEKFNISDSKPFFSIAERLAPIYNEVIELFDFE